MDIEFIEFFDKRYESLNKDKQQLEEAIKQVKDPNSYEYNSYQKFYQQVNEELNQVKKERQDVENWFSKKEKASNERKQIEEKIQTLNKRKEEYLDAKKNEEKNIDKTYILEEIESDLKKIEIELEDAMKKDKKAKSTFERMGKNIEKYKEQHNIKSKQPNQGEIEPNPASAEQEIEGTEEPNPVSTEQEIEGTEEPNPASAEPKVEKTEEPNPVSTEQEIEGTEEPNPAPTEPKVDEPKESPIIESGAIPINTDPNIIPYKATSKEEKEYLTKSITDLQIANTSSYNNVFLEMEKYVNKFFEKNQNDIKEKCDKCKNKEELNGKVEELLKNYRVDDQELSFDAKSILSRVIRFAYRGKFDKEVEEEKSSIFNKIKTKISSAFTATKGFFKRIKEKIQNKARLKNSDMKYLNSAEEPIKGDTNGRKYEDATIDDYKKGNEVLENLDISFVEAPEGVTEKIKAIKDKKMETDKFGYRTEKTEEEEMLDRNNLDEAMNKERENINIDIEIQ